MNNPDESLGEIGCTIIDWLILTNIVILIILSIGQSFFIFTIIHKYKNILTTIIVKYTRDFSIFKK